MTNDSCCGKRREFLFYIEYLKSTCKAWNAGVGGMMQKLLLIGLAGALGALARYGLGGLVQRYAGVTFPWGTFVVNIIGAFLFGFIWSLVEQRLVISVDTRVIILSGFLGAFTTFSSFMFETSSLIGEAQWGLAVLNVVGQIIVGLTAMFLGLAAGRVF
jgi:CrcB protein